MRYTPFGNKRASSGNIHTDKRFTGQQLETGTSTYALYHYGARMYNAGVGTEAAAESLAALVALRPPHDLGTA